MSVGMSYSNVLNKLYKSVLNYDIDKAAEAAREAIRAGLDPVIAIEKGLAKGIREIGEKFAAGEVFLPELIVAAEAMQKAIEVLKPEMERKRVKTKVIGRVVIGTVEGDIHDIGKNLVATMLTVNGFEVVDLGADVPVDVFVNKVKELNPDIVAMSALLTTTMVNQKRVIDKLKEERLRDKVKVLVGGAPITREWVEDIGADGYALDAIEAVEVAKRVLKIL